MCRVSPALEGVFVELLLATQVQPRVGGVILNEESMNHVVTEELRNLFMGVGVGPAMLTKLYASQWYSVFLVLLCASTWLKRVDLVAGSTGCWVVLNGGCWTSLEHRGSLTPWF